ncbi:MAG: DUF4368 domain-containing protein, partial [Ruminococcus sp.]|nr:DUF4368 domain-containing protein [Ruminococcus sp.]
SAYAAQKVGKPKTKPYHWAQKTVREMLANRIYCGDTVNFSTYTKSYKLKKTLKNEPENMLIFENTHEAIISRKLFDVVQKRYEGRRKSDKFGETDKYAGYLYCAECGSRLYISRSKNMKRSKFHYMCAGYQSRIADCTAHYIREEVLDSIVLRYLRQVVSYARDKSDDFYAMAMANGEAEAQKQFKENEMLRNEYESKISQLDNAIQLLFMDRSNGKITDERYDILSANFEKEQSELKAKLSTLDLKFNEMKVREKRVRDFINNAKQYTEIRKLTPEILKIFIWRIEVYEKAVKRSRTCGNRVVIYFTFSADKAIVIDRVISENGDMLIL